MADLGGFGWEILKALVEREGRVENGENEGGELSY